MHNMQVPTIPKMFDGGRHTDMGLCAGWDPNIPEFPTLLHEMVIAQDASGLEQLLQNSVDIYNRWTGTYRTQAHTGGPTSTIGLKAASTALLAGYYEVRKGPDCVSPYGGSYCENHPGNAWPGGCFGEENWGSRVASTLKALPRSRALRPNAPRRAFNISNRSAYAALRSSTSNGDAVIILLNFASSSTTITIGSELTQFGVARPQTPVDLIDGGDGPRIEAGRAWAVTLPSRSWAVYSVSLNGSTANI